MISLDALRAAIEERKRLALTATPGPWTVANNRSVRADAAPKGMVMPSIAASYHWPSRSDAEHIAANSPATVLRQVERDLRVLERHKRYIIPKGYQGAGTPNCNWCNGLRYPCDEVADLAHAYAIPTEEDQ